MPPPTFDKQELEAERIAKQIKGEIRFRFG